MTYEWRPMLKWFMQSKVRRLITDNPGKSSKEILAHADLSESTYMKHLEAMRLGGLIERVKTEASMVMIFRLTEKGLRVLELDTEILRAFTEIQYLTR